MRAVNQRVFGGPEVLEQVELDVPVPGPDDVLVRVRAAGVNPADWKIRSGAAPLFGEPPFVLGFDVAGVVEEVGGNVSRWQPGDAVFGMPTPPAGAYAEFVRAPAVDLAPIPDGLDFIQAAALPAVALTAWQALVGIAEVGAGQRVLVTAAAGGVGHVAVQIAKARGAYVIGTARADKHAFLEELGVDASIDYATADVAAEAPDMDVVFDLIGGANGQSSLRSVRPGGMLLTALWDDPGVEDAEVRRQGRRLGVVQVRPSGAELARIGELVAQDLLRVHVQDVIPLADAAAAHRISERGRVRGKLVLQP
ncbi:NADP-dependent oxidoreductase [Actinomycetes bacterium KLBMP 9759]